MPASSSPGTNARPLGRRLQSAAERFLRILANRDESEGALGRHGWMLASLVVLLVALYRMRARRIQG